MPENITFTAKRNTGQPANMSQKLYWLKRLHADKSLIPAPKNVVTGRLMTTEEGGLIVQSPLSRS